MSRRDDLIELERSAWRALGSSGDAAVRFFTEVLADDVLMLLPGGLVIDDRTQALDAMTDAPWSWFELSDERVFEVNDACAVVAYRASARRDDRDEYNAVFNSTYVRVGSSWRLALHQQTPL